MLILTCDKCLTLLECVDPNAKMEMITCLRCGGTVERYTGLSSCLISTLAIEGPLVLAKRGGRLECLQ